MGLLLAFVHRKFLNSRNRPRLSHSRRKRMRRMRPKRKASNTPGQSSSCCRASFNLVRKVNPKTVLDGFAGTTRVAQALAQSGYRVMANDVSAWSKIFATCYLLNPHPESHYQPLIDHLNALPGRDGWFTEHYGGEANGDFFHRAGTSSKNRGKNITRGASTPCARKWNACPLSETEKAVLLTSLMLALDSVDSTLGHFASYLRHWSPRSYHTLHLKVPRLIPAGKATPFINPTFLTCCQKSRPTWPISIRLTARTMRRCRPRACVMRRIIIFGLRFVYMTSPRCSAKPGGAPTRRTPWPAPSSRNFARRIGTFVALEAIERLLQSTRARHIILSYSSGGRATAEELNEVIHAAGRLVEVLEMDYRKNVMAAMRWTHEWVNEAEAPNKEFLFLIEKRNGL
jgi:adenine-specific DNA-methyltransferase